MGGRIANRPTIQFERTQVQTTGVERVIRGTSFYISGLLLVTSIIIPKNDVLTNLDLGLPVGL